MERKQFIKLLSENNTNGILYATHLDLTDKKMSWQEFTKTLMLMKKLTQTGEFNIHYFKEAAINHYRIKFDINILRNFDKQIVKIY